jgi:hypothetical protein
LGSLAGCAYVSIMYSKGDGVVKNHVAAKEYGDIAADMLKKLKEHQKQIDFGEGT